MTRCPICDAETRQAIGPNPDFPGGIIYRCRACRMMFTHPVPAVEDLEDRYREVYRQTLKESPTPEYLRFMDRRGEAQKALVLEHMTPGATPPRVLDIGCSAGSLLKSFAASAGELTGYEPDTAMVELARRRVPSARIIGSLCEPRDLAADSCEIIAISHVLEHVADPVDFLRGLLRATTPGGLVFVEVPHETVASVREVLRHEYLGKMHLLFFNPRTLGLAGEKAGGEVLTLRTYGPPRDRFSMVGPEHRRARPDSLVTRGIRRLRRAFRVDDAGGLVHRVTESDLREECGDRGIYIRAIFRRA